MRCRLFPFLRPRNLGYPSRRSSAKGRPNVELLETRLTPTTLPDGFREVLVAEGLDSPTAMAFAPDGRIFVAEQTGNLRVIKDGNLLPTPFVSLDVNAVAERGLLGVTFDPDFATNQYVYVYYTVATEPIHNRVSRFTANGDVALDGSEVPLLDLDNLDLDAPYHNGGAIHFGLDGKLYVAVGENGNPDHAQTVTNLLGKVLRINADGSIPEDNPFVSDPTARGEIWALGFRNPFTFAVQPGTGRIFVNDVGSIPPEAREEINDLIKGGNYGWPLYEGYTDDPNFISPLYAYPSGQGDGTCAIVGGTFYNPDNVQFPGDYVGTYFFSDLCAGWIRRFDPVSSTVTEFATDTSSQVVDLAVDNAGSLYYLSRAFPSAVYRIDYVGAAAHPSGIVPKPSFDRVVALIQAAQTGWAVTDQPPPGPLAIAATEELRRPPLGVVRVDQLFAQRPPAVLGEPSPLHLQRQVPGWDTWRDADPLQESLL